MEAVNVPTQDANPGQVRLILPPRCSPDSSRPTNVLGLTLGLSWVAAHTQVSEIRCTCREFAIAGPGCPGFLQIYLQGWAIRPKQAALHTAQRTSAPNPGHPGHPSHMRLFAPPGPAPMNGLTHRRSVK